MSKKGNSKKEKRIRGSISWWGAEFKEDGRIMENSIRGTKEGAIRAVVGHYLRENAEHMDIGEVMGHWCYRRKLEGLRVIGLSVRQTRRVE